MNPLAVTFRPILETEIGKKNLNSFIYVFHFLTLIPSKSFLVSWVSVGTGTPKFTSLNITCTRAKKRRRW